MLVFVMFSGGRNDPFGNEFTDIGDQRDLLFAKTWIEHVGPKSRLARRGASTQLAVGARAIATRCVFQRWTFLPREDRRAWVDPLQVRVLRGRATSSSASVVASGLDSPHSCCQTRGPGPSCHGWRESSG